MEFFPLSLQRLARELSKLPSIGERSASRLAYFLTTEGKHLIPELCESMKIAAENVKLCTKCYYLCERDLCRICERSDRDPSIVCVVEKPMDVPALERSGEYHGLYHVLHGLWAPLRGRGPDSIKIQELLDRANADKVKEIILATSSTVEGDATALYLARALSEMGIITTRLAQGMPKGGELEYADEVTLQRAITGRTSFSA